MTSDTSLDLENSHLTIDNHHMYNSWHNSNGIQKLFVFLFSLPYIFFLKKGPMGETGRGVSLAVR